MVRHVLELVWVPVSGTYLGLIKMLPSVSHASRWQANATNRKQRAPAQKRDEHSFRSECARRALRSQTNIKTKVRGKIILRNTRALCARRVQRYIAELK